MPIHKVQSDLRSIQHSCFKMFMTWNVHTDNFEQPVPNQYYSPPKSMSKCPNHVNIHPKYLWAPLAPGAGLALPQLLSASDHPVTIGND